MTMRNSNSSRHSNLPGLSPSLLMEEEAAAVESAIRAAVDSVVAVMRGACSRTLLEYQRRLEERELEVRRLESKLEQSESEVTLLREEVRRRQPGVPACGGSDQEEVRRRQPGVPACGGSDQEEEVRRRQPGVRACGGSDQEEVQRRQPGVRALGGAGGATTTHLSPKPHDTAEAFPHQHAQNGAPSLEGEGAAGCITSVIKEEPSDLEPVIKWEVCEGSLLDQQEAGGAEHQHQETAAMKNTRVEFVAKTANSQMNKVTTTEEEDEPAANLKRRGGERNGCRQPETEEEVVVVKKPCVTYSSVRKTTALNDNLSDIGSTQLHWQSSNGSITSKLHAQEPLACQQPTYITMTTPQPTCDPILLEVLVSLETIKQQNTTVLQILQSGNSPGAPLSEPPDVGTLPLPLQSVQDLRCLEQRLSAESELKKRMISYLGLSGGMTTKESVWRIMAKLFTNTLAKNINWRGRNNKQKIENLTIKRVIINAVRQNSFCKDAVDEEIERFIKRWLQLAGDRDGGRKRRQEKGKESASMQEYCMDDMFTHVIE
ncbi:uncharacterized protein LOC117776262 isoform X3 [Hippoglossus hippoglossus]|uniref:uncharacterized protein LOC117776262 isoform X3 n=1 Tax=Hippoglossus hippoglossus TaxID=8267 RepID=UPI00148C7743|nr:uncharacterized protein LOC117776262 isoform X3 [Hippoglossus hippoglossus]